MAQLVVHTGSSAWNTRPATDDRISRSPSSSFGRIGRPHGDENRHPVLPLPPRFRGCTRNSGSYSHSNMAPQHHGRMAQLVEHIVHIDGVTGSSPVATTTIRPKTQFSDGYFMHNTQKQAAIQPKIAKQRGYSPQNSAIFLIFGIAILR